MLTPRNKNSSKLTPKKMLFPLTQSKFNRQKLCLQGNKSEETAFKFHCNILWQISWNLSWTWRSGSTFFHFFGEKNTKEVLRRFVVVSGMAAALCCAAGGLYWAAERSTGNVKFSGATNSKKSVKIKNLIKSNIIWNICSQKVVFLKISK